MSGNTFSIELNRLKKKQQLETDVLMQGSAECIGQELHLDNQELPERQIVEAMAHIRRHVQAETNLFSRPTRW